MFVLFGAVVTGAFSFLSAFSFGGAAVVAGPNVLESDGGAGGDRHHDDDHLGRHLHLVLSRASANGLPTSPSIVATATWKFCCASCSRSRAWTTLACASSTSSSERSVPDRSPARSHPPPRGTSAMPSRATPPVRAASPAACRRHARPARSARCGWPRARPASSPGFPGRTGYYPGSDRTPGSAPTA